MPNDEKAAIVRRLIAKDCRPHYGTERLGHAQLTSTAIYADAVVAEEKDIARRMWGQSVDGGQPMSDRPHSVPSVPGGEGAALGATGTTTC
jgi:hypothetical protein